MAVKETIKVLIDDLDGTEGTEGEVSTHTFSVDGHKWSIDLSQKNADALMKALSKFIGKATEVRTATRSDRDTNVKIREWAKANGIEVQDKGKLPEHVKDAYDKAHAA